MNGFLLLLILGTLLLIGSVAWMYFFRNTAAGTSTVGQAATKAIDTAGVIAAYVSLTGIRTLDSVEADSKAIEACDYLRGVVTAWKRPAPIVPANIPVATTP